MKNTSLLLSLLIVLNTLACQEAPNGVSFEDDGDDDAVTTGSLTGTWTYSGTITSSTCSSTLLSVGAVTNEDTMTINSSECSRDGIGTDLIYTFSSGVEEEDIGEQEVLSSSIGCSATSSEVTMTASAVTSFDIAGVGSCETTVAASSMSMDYSSSSDSLSGSGSVSFSFSDECEETPSSCAITFSLTGERSSDGSTATVVKQPTPGQKAPRF